MRDLIEVSNLITKSRVWRWGQGGEEGGYKSEFGSGYWAECKAPSPRWVTRDRKEAEEGRGAVEVTLDW